MFKDYDKYLSTSLKVYLFLLIIIFIMKIVGLDYFGLDINNQIIVNISNFLDTTRLDIVLNVLLLFLYTYILMSVSLNEKKVYKYTSIMVVFGITIQTILFKLNLQFLKTPLDVIIWIIFFTITGNKKNIKRLFAFMIFNILFQYISVLTRSNNDIVYLNNTVMEMILSFDYIILMIILYKINFTKGDYKLCGQEVGSYLQMKSHFTNLQKEFRKNYSNFKRLNKQEKATIIIYSILSLIWNIFTVFVVLFIARLNDTFVECIFILSSFWLSKKVFGKPFHLKSMLQCFILSNLTYYILNRITTPTGISILIPIMLGVGLSYITSKLVKKTYKPLYKGMPKEDFENTILKVADKDSTKYQICYDYFINKDNAVYLGHKYNYSEAGIRKITSRINDDIKTLN